MNDFIYGELGRTSYQVRRYLFIVKYWFKLLSSRSYKYSKLVYNLMLRDIELLPTKVNWASLVRHLFCSLGFYEVWVQQGVGDYSKYISVLKQRLNDNFIQNWRARLEESPRATFYKSIAAFQLQPYLENIIVYKLSQALSKLRVSSHRLEIEAGRWSKPARVPINERKCVNCQVIEDEYHFIIECHLYNDLRKKYISKYFWIRPSMFKFVELINSTNQNCIRKLGAFIYQAFKLRTELLY